MNWSLSFEKLVIRFGNCWARVCLFVGKPALFPGAYESGRNAALIALKLPDDAIPEAAPWNLDQVLDDGFHSKKNGSPLTPRLRFDFDSGCGAEMNVIGRHGKPS